MAGAPRTALAAALGVSCVLLAPPAKAEPALVTGLSNLLSIGVVPPAATLTTTGGTSTGSLGTTTVVDGRLNAGYYDVSVSTSGFNLVGATVSNSATHIPSSAVTVQNTAFTGGTSSRTTAVALPSVSPIFRLSYAAPVLGLNLASSYTMSMTINVPAPAANGLYTGTVTQTIA
jgi:hypothetical protein